MRKIDHENMWTMIKIFNLKFSFSGNTENKKTIRNCLLESLERLNNTTTFC